MCLVCVCLESDLQYLVGVLTRVHTSDDMEARVVLTVINRSQRLDIKLNALMHTLPSAQLIPLIEC